MKRQRETRQRTIFFATWRRSDRIDRPGAVLPVDGSQPGIGHSHLDIVRPDGRDDSHLLVVARRGAASRPLARLVVPRALISQPGGEPTGQAWLQPGMLRFCR